MNEYNVLKQYAAMSSDEDTWIVWTPEAPWWNNPVKKTEPPKCECGTTITMGKDDHPSFHNEDCPVRREHEGK